MKLRMFVLHLKCVYSFDYVMSQVNIYKLTFILAVFLKYLTVVMLTTVKVYLRIKLFFWTSNVTFKGF